MSTVANIVSWHRELFQWMKTRPPVGFPSKQTLSGQLNIIGEQWGLKALSLHRPQEVQVPLSGGHNSPPHCLKAVPRAKKHAFSLPPHPNKLIVSHLTITPQYCSSQLYQAQYDVHGSDHNKRRVRLTHTVGKDARNGSIAYLFSYNGRKVSCEPHGRNERGL